MATKDQVLKLLERGLNPQQIAKKLGCKDAYVRATRRRAQVEDYEKQFPSYARSIERCKERYRTDPKYRARKKKISRDWYQRQKLAEQSQSAN